ncbi:MAG: hypothetical protein ACREJC_20245, partial [Tepidisphaeraceae bacterium]
MMEAVTFLRGLFGRCPEDLWILLWELPDKTSHWIEAGADQEIQILLEVQRNHDWYCGVSLSPRDFGSKRRCRSEDAAGIVGLWADID